MTCVILKSWHFCKNLQNKTWIAWICDSITWIAFSSLCILYRKCDLNTWLEVAYSRRRIFHSASARQKTWLEYAFGQVAYSVLVQKLKTHVPWSVFHFIFFLQLTFSLFLSDTIHKISFLLHIFAKSHQPNTFGASYNLSNWLKSNNNTSIDFKEIED